MRVVVDPRVMARHSEVSEQDAQHAVIHVILATTKVLTELGMTKGKGGRHGNSRRERHHRQRRDA